MSPSRLLLPLACLWMAGCASNSYCLTEQEYQKATVVPELQPVDGLAVPASPSSLRLPKPPTNPEPFGRRDADGSGMCLDKPPALPPSAIKPEPEQEAPAPKNS